MIDKQEKLTIPQQIKAIRKANKLTQEQFAEKLGFAKDKNKIFRYEAGRVVPPVEVLQKIVDTFKVEIKIQ